MDPPRGPNQALNRINNNNNKRLTSLQALEKDLDSDVIMTDVNALAVKIAAILAQTSSSSKQKKDKRP